MLENAATAVSLAESEAVYGHLIIVLRDTYDKADDINQMIFGTEELGKNATHKDKQALDQRNSVRTQLKKSFQEIKVWCLPQPHSDINGEINL